MTLVIVRYHGVRQDRTARSQLPGQGSYGRTILGQNRKDRTARTGQLEQDSQNGTARMGPKNGRGGVDRQNKIGRTEQAEQDCQDRTTRTGLSEQDF
jgi:hypothetical protein